MSNFLLYSKWKSIVCPQKDVVMGGTSKKRREEMFIVPEWRVPKRVLGDFVGTWMLSLTVPFFKLK